MMAVIVSLMCLLNFRDYALTTQSANGTSTISYKLLKLSLTSESDLFFYTAFHLAVELTKVYIGE